MAYEVLARKWRPRQMADVIGQEHVTRTLQHAIESGRVAHAYLFVGPRGIGKTTLSRIFAKALNCEHGPTPTPCDQCDLCREIMAGNALDVIEIDAASNNGVDNIRDLRDSIQFAPARARYKIYIIDEVHMLSTGAFNALLKTLEEPPPHAKFIFATTEIDKLPATIISRCQRFDLRRIPTTLIVDYLRHIAEEEGVKADGDALLAIARGAEGGMRDALGALDQIISFKGNDVTEQDVLAVFGLVSRSQLEDLAAAILKGDMAAGLRIIDDLDRKGKDLRRLAVELMEHFRNLLVRQQLGDDAVQALDVTPEQLASLDAQTKLADSGRLLRVTEHLADLESRIRMALSRRTLFETVFLRCCRAATVVTLDQVIKQLTMLKDGAAATAGGP
ncbi:MAG: DNA polymerase III subunit gamma/tau, partial [Kiritimatiellae bacterium]|nr:DNA polymerase III subunit gamma/tau [Kiritimatiellia bacterium]